jgi:hypothetical protein
MVVPTATVSESETKPLPFGPWNWTRQKHKHDAAIGMRPPRLPKAGVQLLSGFRGGQNKSKISEHELKVASHVSQVSRVARCNRTVALAPNCFFALFQFGKRNQKPLQLQGNSNV